MLKREPHVSNRRKDPKALEHGFERPLPWRGRRDSGHSAARPAPRPGPGAAASGRLLSAHPGEEGSAWGGCHVKANLGDGFGAGGGSSLLVTLPVGDAGPATPGPPAGAALLASRRQDARVREMRSLSTSEAEATHLEKDCSGRPGAFWLGGGGNFWELGAGNTSSLRAKAF